MATANVLPIYARLSQKILRKTLRPRTAGDTEMVEGLGRFWLVLRCPMHAWSWPRSNKEERVTGYDAHQTCYKCSSHRAFDTRQWQSGPVYRRQREQRHYGNS